MAIFVVTSLIGTGAGTLPDAIVQANSMPGMDTIQFDLTGPQSTIILDGPLFVTDQLMIDAGVSLGQVPNVTIDGQGSDRIFHISTPGSVMLHGLGLQNGSASRGGAIYNDRSDLHIQDSLITGNTASEDGGGLYNAGGTITITNTTISGNTAGEEGGGLWNSSGGTLTIENSTISGNTASGDSSDQGGGGIFNDGGILDLNGATISGNTAVGTSGSGGGIFNNDGVLLVTGSTIDGNDAVRAGGGIENSGGGSVTLTETILEGNNAGIVLSSNPGNGGGLHVTGGGSVTITGGSISGNTADSEGGGLWNSATGTITINGSLIDGNTASGDSADNGGGGLFNDGGTLTIRGATISGNTADGAAGSGGGIFNTGGNLTISDTMIGGNDAVRAGGGIEIVEGTVTLRNVDIVINSVNSGTGNPGNGGGLHVTGAANVLFDGGTVNDNLADREGGGLWNSSTGTVLINGTTISGNTASGDAADNGGGGVFNNGGGITINNATITGNSADGAEGAGGGILNDGGTVTITNSNVGGNFAQRAGGGIEIDNGGVTLTNSHIDDNSSGVNGGGIHLTGPGDITISGGTVSNNDAPNQGGGFWNSDMGTLQINGTTISGNTVSGPGTDQGGGGIFNNGGTVTLTNALIDNNQVQGGGGGVRGLNGILNIDNSTISHNSANSNGGGIYNYRGDLTINDSTVSGNNSMANGGGISTLLGPININNTWVENNHAELNGGGLLNFGGPTNINHSIFRGNNADGPRGGGAYLGYSHVHVSQSVFDGNAAASDAGGLLVDSPNGNATIIGSTISNNSASSIGGAMFTNGGTVQDSLIMGNAANGQPGYTAGVGGIGAVFDGNLSIIGTRIVQNSSTASAGGVGAIFGGSATLTNSHVANNNTAFYGGGLYSDFGTLDVQNSVISGNTAGNSGGGLFNRNGETLLTNSHVITNSSGNVGGGIHLPSLFSDGSTLVGNSDIGGLLDIFTTSPIGSSTFISTMAGVADDPAPGVPTPPTGLMVGFTLEEKVPNTAPDAKDDSDEVVNGQVVTIDVLANDEDAENNIIGIMHTGTTPNGRVTIVNGGLKYEANQPGFIGQDTFTYTIFDKLNETDTATVTVNVLAVNQPPVAQDGIEAITDEDTDISVEVVDPASDPENDPISLQSASIVSGLGSVSISGTQLVYSSQGIFFDFYDHLAPGDFEVVQIEYTIAAVGGTDTSTVFVTVNGVNDAPIAVDDEGVTDENTSKLIDAVANDQDVDGGPLMIQSADIVGAGLGEALVENNMIRFDPGDDFQRLQTGETEVVQVFYQVSDGTGGVDTGTVFVTVNGINDPPIANPDFARTMPDTAIIIPVLANDTDVDGGPLMLLNAFPATSGTVTANGDGTVTYTPAPGFTGIATFEYEVGDGNGGKAQAAVSVDVNANRPPVANDDMVTTDEDTAITISTASLLNNDTDPDGDAISFVDFTYIDFGPDVDGSMTRVGNNLIYTPDPDINGFDCFEYRITDGEFTVTGFVDIDVKPVNDKPVAVNDLFVTNEDVAITLSFDDLLANDTDVDFPPPADPTLFLDLIAVGGASRGFVTVDFIAETIIYKPNANFNGADSFTYTIQDTGIPLPPEMDGGVVNITVTPVNDPPFIIPPQLQLFTLPNLPVSYLVTAGDVDGDALTITADGEMNGTVTALPELGLGGLTYTPDPDFEGTDGFAVQVTDPSGATATQTVTVEVGQPPDADQFLFFLSAGFVGGIGGSGLVVGNAGFQDVTVFDVPGLVVLDPSFNGGGDILRMPGLSSDWFIFRQGSSALATDGDTFVLIPVGINGLAVVFDNFDLELRFDQAESTFKIGEQAFGSDMFVQITAIEELASLPTGGDPAAAAVLFVAETASVALSGRVDIFGTQSGEMFSLMGGDITIDASANRGGDNVGIPDTAIDGTGQRIGSSFFFDGPTTDLLIPVGLNPTSLQFPDGSRELFFDQTSGMISLGGQLFGNAPEALMMIG